MVCDDRCEVDGVADGDVAVCGDDGGDVFFCGEDGSDECNVGWVGRAFESC